MTDFETSRTSPDGQPTRARDGQTRTAVSGAVDTDLRSDVRFLGSLLGRVLTEAVGPDLLADVESLRAAVIAAYEGGGDEVQKSRAIVEAFDHDRAEQVARAFTVYFHLSNLAEEHHRVRVLRRRGGGTDGLTATVSRLADELGPDEAARRLADLRFHPVFTAHPTEARRRAVASTIRRISDLLDERDQALNPVTLAESERRLLEDIDTLWRTSPIRTTRPTPLDEVRTAMNVFDQTLFEVVPQVYRLLDDGLHGDTAGREPAAAPAFMKLSSWIGGDRDGNPHVTAEVTAAAAEIAAEHVLIGLQRATTRIGSTLTLDENDTPADPDLVALAARQKELDADAASRIGIRSPNESHRRVLLFVAARLDATRRADGAPESPLAYTDPAELLVELRVVQASLRSAGAHRAANGELQNLIWQVETFGFHLAELEVRQHSQVHRTALAEARAGGDLGEMTVEVLDVFRTIADIQRRRGVIAASRYIVSFTQSSADLANVYELAEIALGSAEAAPVLDVIPLFETFADLEASTRILEEALQTEAVQRRLAQTGRKLEVMLGYSDSSKDVGPVSATLALFDAQSRIAQWARDNDIELTLFHGRGGAMGRGGGPANQAVLAQPRGSVENRFKLTEQGEVIFAHYGNQTIAARHIEQMAAAALQASAPSTENRNEEAAARFAPLAAQMDTASRDAFFGLVKAEGFAQWFATVTPMEEVGLLALGSRPARRGLSVESLEDLRAIPWVFAWTQARINLAGWYGLGSALEAIGDVDVLRDAYANWPLFSTMIDNVELSLAKTDRNIAREYLGLAERTDLAERLLDEMDRTREWVLATSGHSDVLEGRPVLSRAVRLRSPYVDALSLLQLRALRGIRRSVEKDPADADHRLLLLAVNGIAAGLQNTG
ncbi:phosphoenolpyruvate carboxylase [Frigoribacterium sp. 2-23]|uniref:phosphoenolpyruvate carboxylase n=1 Tax=Frigoribacterium sp. 2-23 TaxID=3415006 RepID=UPI003C704373